MLGELTFNEGVIVAILSKISIYFRARVLLWVVYTD
jgi:hypothetical protein